MKLQQMFQWLVPRDERFRALFREDAENLRVVGRMLFEVLRETAAG